MNKDKALKILKIGKEAIKKEYGVAKIGVFGSYARGEQTSKSDIDILVEFGDKRASYFDLIKLENHLKKSLHIHKVDLATKAMLHPVMKKQILKEVVYV